MLGKHSGTEPHPQSLETFQMGRHLSIIGDQQIKPLWLQNMVLAYKRMGRVSGGVPEWGRPGHMAGGQYEHICQSLLGPQKVCAETPFLKI